MTIQSTTNDDAPRSTMEILQNEMEKKWEREQAEEAREARLADKPLGPDKSRTPADDQAFYKFHGGVEKGDRIEWDDGEVNEVIGVVPAQQSFDPEYDPLGDIIHVRVVEAGEFADEYECAQQVGDQNNFNDFVLGGAIADGTVEIESSTSWSE